MARPLTLSDTWTFPEGHPTALSIAQLVNLLIDTLYHLHPSRIHLVSIKMNNPFAEEALFAVNATDARVTVIQAQLSNLDLDTVRTTPGARAILAGSKGANQIDHQDVFLFPYSEDVNEAGAPICNCTAVSLATTDTLMILVADTDGGMAGRLFLVGSTLGIGISLENQGLRST